MSAIKLSRLGAEAQEAIRIRLVHYLQGSSGTQVQTAIVFTLSVSTVKQIWKRYQQQGWQGIMAHKPSMEALSATRLARHYGAQAKATKGC